MFTRNDNDLFSCIQEHYSDINISKFMSLTEDDKVNISRNLIDKIYVNIAERYNEIDFETIPKSAGDITKMTEYNNLRASLDLLKDIAESSKQRIPEIQTLDIALDNIIKLKDKFREGFMKKNASVILLYNLLTMSVYCGVSLMISVMVDYINIGNTDSVQLVINRKYSRTNSYLMISSLETFNTQVRKGSFNVTLSALGRPVSLQEDVRAIGVTAGAIIAAIIAVFGVIPLTKELIYLFYYSRMRVSEAAKIQSELINANIESIKAQGIATPKMVKIQKWFADKLEKISQVFAIKYERNEKKAQDSAKAKLGKADITLF